MEGGYYYREIDPKAFTPFGKQDAEGYYIQAGYFLIPKHLEIVTRYSFVEPDNPSQIANNEQEEFTLGANYYFLGHRLKTQLNYSLFSTKAGNGVEDDHLIQTSIGLQF